MKTYALAALLMLSSAPALAQTGPDEVSLTVYNSNLALVSEQRSLDLARGEQVVELPGVSSQIQPTTANFFVEGVEILEQNFDYDLLSPSKLMEKHVGQFVDVIRTNPGNGNVSKERAKVLSVNNGVVVQIGNTIEVLRDDNLPTRVVFPQVPENLRAEPTLSIRVDSARGGAREANLSYLTGGMSWRADYVASFDEDAGELALQGWATLTNNTETTFTDASVAVVAGDVAGRQNPNRYNQYNSPRGNFNRAGTQGVDTERLGDNYLYPLPGEITVRASQTKQVGIVDADGLDAGKVYVFDTYGFNTNSNPQSVAVRIGFTNEGTALPTGTLRVYQKDAQERSQFVGEDQIGHIPAGSDMAVKIGEAFDLRVQPTITEDKRISRKVRDVSMRYRVTNASKTKRIVEVRQRMPRAYWSADYDVLSESQDHALDDAYTYIWKVEVPAEGEKLLEFTVRERSRW